jgi:hypothetical protein
MTTTALAVIFVVPQARSQSAAPEDSLAAAAAVKETSVPDDAGPFAKGQKRFAFTAGYASGYGDDYLFIGAGAGVFIADGLDVGVDLESWFLGDPLIYKLSPEIRYTFWKPVRTKPYIGGFYRRTFVSDAPDVDSIGGRGGIYYISESGAIVGGGIVYERFLDCDNAFDSCDEFYPEVVFAFSF